MRKAWMFLGAAAVFGLAGSARAQQAALFLGSVSPTTRQIQNVSIVEMSPLVAPIPNQPPKATMFDKTFKRLRQFLQPTLGNNPVASLKTSRNTTTNPVTPTTFDPQAPFFNGH